MKYGCYDPQSDGQRHHTMWGGYVYRGSRVTQLTGYYLYIDYNVR